MMDHKVFKNSLGERFACAVDGSQDDLIQADWVLLTADEVAAINADSDRTLDGLKKEITQKRWEVETGGITLPTGVRVATAIDDQNRITSVVANAERSGLAVFDFKAESGWVRVTLAELQGIATAMAQHVQACFSAERLHHEAIDALEERYKNDSLSLQAALTAYDASQGWPPTEVRAEG